MGAYNIDVDRPQGGGVVNAKLKEKTKIYLTSAGIYCPGSGGSTAIAQIAQSFEGKASYRLGGKGMNLGSKNPGYVGKDKNRSCPIDTGTICIDCSGFVNLVLQCAGMTDGTIKGGLGTGSMFGGSMGEKVKNFDTGAAVINGTPLVPGDLLGFSASPYGHVGIYIGGGKVAESASSGRATNRMIIISPLSQKKRYMKEVLRVTQFK